MKNLKIQNTETMQFHFTRVLKSNNNLKKSNKDIMLTPLKIPQVMRKVNSTGEDKDHPFQYLDKKE